MSIVSKKNINISFLSFLLFLSIEMLAQNPHPYFRNFTTEHGLPSSEVHYALEDDNGYMWFATDNGVSRFDGYSFKNFGPQEGLKHHVAFFLQKANDGTIWIATMNGHLYFVKGDKILPFEKNDLIEKYGQNGNTLFDFYIDPSNETKYISIIGSGVLTFSKDNDFRYYKNTSGAKLSLIRENRWLSEGGLFQLNLKKPRGNISFLRSAPHTVIILDTIKTEEGTWEKKVIASNFGYLNFNDSSGLFFCTDYLFQKETDSLRLIKVSDFMIYNKSVFRKKNGTYLIGCQKGHGLKRVKNTNQLLTDSLDHFLDGKSITHIFKDSKNTYWISTIEHGVFYTSDFEQKIFDTSIGLSSNHISALAFKNKNELFIGLRDGNLFMLNTLKNQLTQLPKPFKEKGIIYDLGYDEKREELWMTNSVRSSYFKNGYWKQMNYKSSLNNRLVILLGRKIYLNENSSTLWGTNSTFFSAIDVDKKKKKIFSPEIGINERVFAIKESLDNRVWIGSGRGLLEFKNDKLIEPTPFYNAFHSRIEDLDELQDSTLVIATKGEGVLLWKGNYFKQFTKADGLSSDMIENIHVDSSGKIWVGTLEGLSVITPIDSSHQIRSYTMWHGLPSNEITEVCSRGKQVWVGTTKGLIQWKTPNPIKKIPQPIIEKVMVNDEILSNRNKDKFSYQSNNFKFRFLSINYRMPGKIPYRFRLNNSPWNTTQNRSASYTNLVPGKYFFEVQSQTEDGKWSAAANHQFTIQPPWWTTWWFRGLVVLSCGGLAFGWYRNRTERYRKENALLQEINQLERKALQAQMNPHFIFNSLNSIQYAILQKNNDHAVTYLSKFAAFTRWVLKASADGKVLLEEEINFLKNYLSLEKLRFKNKFEYHFEVDKKLSLSSIYVQPLMIQPIVENAIQHGMKGKTGNGKINLIFTDANDRIHIKVCDNGKGISPKKNESRIYQPMGMSITKRRLEVAGEEVPMKFKTLKDEHGNVEGTEVRFFLKKI